MLNALIVNPAVLGRHSQGVSQQTLQTVPEHCLSRSGESSSDGRQNFCMMLTQIFVLVAQLMFYGASDFRSGRDRYCHVGTELSGYVSQGAPKGRRMGPLDIDSPSTVGGIRTVMGYCPEIQFPRLRKVPC